MGIGMAYERQQYVGIAGLLELSEEVVRVARLQLEDCLARRVLGEATDAEVERYRSVLDTAEREYAYHPKVHSTASTELDGLHRQLTASEETARLAQSLRLKYERILACGYLCLLPSGHLPRLLVP